MTPLVQQQNKSSLEPLNMNDSNSITNVKKLAQVTVRRSCFCIFLLNIISFYLSFFNIQHFKTNQVRKAKYKLEINYKGKTMSKVSVAV